MVYIFQGLKFQFYFLLIVLFVFLLPGSLFSQIGLKLKKPVQTVDLFEEELFGMQKFEIDTTFFNYDKKISLYKRTVTFDSSGKFVSINEKIDDTEFYFPAVMDLDTYVDKYLQFNKRQLFKKKVVQFVEGLVEKEFGAIELDIPLRIKNETFRRIFGSDKISLRVTGNISFDISGRTEKRGGEAVSAQEARNTFSPRFNQTQQFTVEGKIGDKVTVSVEQNSEATTDIENTLKLRYDGEEDEIVQSIQAGNISLSLPSTKYVIFGGSNQGLFGLKSEMKLGNLHLTAIASLEKGQQQELSISGGSSTSKISIKDINYLKNQYFFVNNEYYDYWDKGFKTQGAGNDYKQFIANDNIRINEIDVWVQALANEEGKRDAIALINPLEDNDSTGYKASFRALKEDEFDFDQYTGILKVNNPIANQNALAVSYRVGLSSQTVGDLSTDDSTETIKIKLIKEANQNSPDSPLWKLNLKNVYSLGGSDIQKEGFKLNIFHEKNQEEVQGDESYLSLLGLDISGPNGTGGADGEFDINYEFIDYKNGIIIFPDLTPFDPSSSSFDGLKDENKVKVYNETNEQNRLNESKYSIQVESISTKSTFDLGFYVLEGSEVVTLNGKDLERDVDYTIDYFSGTLSLISDEALRSSSNINIKYERANLFQLDKKTILGGRAEYRFLDNSFIGATALYLNKTTVDTRVRIGQEPFQNFVWDINAAFKFKPRFLTKAMDALPLIETTAESEFNIEGEFAQVLPDPNTLNSEKTGDDNGVAYIDDFESSKRTTTLGIGYKGWTAASAPVKLPGLNGKLDPLALDKTRAHFVWFNPYNQTYIEDVWPERETNSQTGQTMDVLGIEFYRDENSDADSSWGGIMRSTASFSNQQRTKYIELWINGDVGTLHIDIGEISEDWWVRGKTHDGKNSYGGLNREDKDELGYYKDEFDTGIDGIEDDIGDVDVNGDNWKNHEGKRTIPGRYDELDYRGINGTEGNGRGQGSKFPDTEDLNSNSSLETRNNYFTYSFSLDPDKEDEHGYITGKTEKGWRQFRIPIRQPTESVGNPDTTFQTIVNVRLRVSDIPRVDYEHAPRIKIATFDFVGNEWDELGYREYSESNLPPGSIDANGNPIEPYKSSEDVFVITTYNSEENVVDLNKENSPDPYTGPPGVTGQKDRITNTRSKEQSLVMRFEGGLPPNYVAEAKKTLFSKIELVNYKRLKMFLYGSKRLIPGDNVILPSDPEDESDIIFYMRFGSDDNNYYEYGREVFQGWKYNNINIDLAELAALDGFENEIKRNGNEYLLAKGSKVSLNSIHYFIIGVRNKNTMKKFKGEVWLDEMRLSDIRGESATALRLKTNLRLADVLNVTAEWESKDADFHNISTQFGSGNTLERQNYTATFNFDKLLPAVWGMSVPFDARGSFSKNVPKYYPVSDDLTGYRNNTLSKKVQSLFGLKDIPKKLEDKISVSESFGVGTTIRKKDKSKHWFPKYTIDQLTLDFDYSRSNNSSFLEKYKKTTSYKEKYNFGIPFGNKNYIEPFSYVKDIPVLDDIHATKLFYSPTSIKLSLNVSDVVSESQKRSEDAPVNRSRTTGTSRNIGINYKLLHNLDLKYSRSYTTDADFDSISRLQLYNNIIKKFSFGKETNIKQSFDAGFKPDIFSWMSTDFSFGTNFNYQLLNSYQWIGAQNNSAKKVSSTISPNKLISLFYTPDKKSTTPRSRPRRRGQAKEKTDKEDENEDLSEGKKEKDSEKDEEQSDENQISFNPLSYIYSAIDSWKSIRVSYTRNDGVANSYLSAFPEWPYQFGFTQDPGVPQDSSLLDQGIVLQKPNTKESHTLKTSTKIQIGKISADFSHDYKRDLSVTNNGENKNETVSITYLALGKDPLKSYNSSSLLRFVPNWSLSIPEVEKWFFFSSFADKISITHAHTGKYDIKRALQLDKFVPKGQNFGNSWSPLFSVNIKTIWDVSTTIRMTDNTNYSYQADGSASRSESQSLSIDAKYSKSTGFEIPLPFWPFKGRTFKNEINFAILFDLSNSTSYLRSGKDEDFKEQTKNSSWKIRPSATYKFNTRVTGSMFFETGANETKTTGIYSYSEFGINVNIAIRD